MAEVEDSSLHRPYLRFAFAVLIVAAALLLQRAIVHIIGAELPPFITLYPAIMVVALLCGLRPGLLATLLAALSADYWLILPHGNFAIANPAEAIGLALFASMGIFMSVVAEAYRRNQMRVAALKSEVALHESQQELRRSEEQFETLANAIPQLCWMANADGWIFWYNQRWYDYTGTTPEQMEGWGWQSVHDPEALPKVMARWQGSIATGEPFDMVFPLQGADGVFRPFLTRVMPVKDAEGKVVRWFGTNTDISEQKRAEIELRKSKERLDLAVEVAGLGEWELNLKDDTSTQSLRHQQIFGYSSPSPDWSYAKFLDHVLPELRDAVDGQIHSGDSWSIETKIRRADGEVRWIWVRGRRRVNDAGQVVRMFGVVTDITERKQAEEALRQQADMLRLSFDAILVWRLDGGIESWNRGAELLYGYSESEALGPVTHNLLRTTHFVPWPEIEAALRTRGSWEGELRHVTKDGREVTVSARHQLIVGADGIERVLETNRDITESKLAQESLRSSEAKLQGVIGSAMDAIISVDDEQRIVVFNRAAEKIFQCPAAEALGSSVSRFIPERLRAAHGEHIRRFGEQGVTNRSMNSPGILAGVRSNGEEFPIEATISHVQADGQTLYTVILRDITERKQAEEALRLRVAALDAAANSIVMTDAAGNIQWVNPAFTKMTGYTSEEAIGQNPRVLKSGKHDDQFYKDMWKQVISGWTWRGELVNRRKDGSLYVEEMTITPVRAADGSISNFLAVKEDITERKRAERALRASEHRYRTLFETMDEGFCVIEMIFDEQGRPADYRFLQVNPAFEKQTGLHEAEGKRMREFAPEHEAHWFEIYGKVALTGESAHFMNEARALDRWYDVHAYRVGEPELRRVAIVFNDISDSKRAEQALQASEHRWSTTLRSIGDAVISTDPAGNIDFMNEVAERLTGWTLAEAKGRELPAVFDIVQEVTRIRPEDPVAKVIRFGKVVGLANHTVLIHRDGNEIPIEDSAAPIRDDEGKMEGVVLVFHDVLEQRKVEAVLRSSERLATMGRLAATIAHEIHNPLDAVGNLLFLIREDAKDDSTREYASMAGTELARVTQMTQQMLGFQREASKPMPVKIGEILANVVALYNRKIQTAGIRLEQRIDPEARVVALPGELRQIFANLVGNAIEAVGPRHGTIALRAYPSLDRRRGVPGVCVVVADNGPGIPEQVRGKIFEPFFTTKGESGTGLGLWITADILRKYDGAMRLRTCTHPERSGTCFSVFLPSEINSESPPGS